MPLELVASFVNESGTARRLVFNGNIVVKFMAIKDGSQVWSVKVWSGETLSQVIKMWRTNIPYQSSFIEIQMAKTAIYDAKDVLKIALMTPPLG